MVCAFLDPPGVVTKGGVLADPYPPTVPRTGRTRGLVGVAAGSHRRPVPPIEAAFVLRHLGRRWQISSRWRASLWDRARLGRDESPITALVTSKSDAGRAPGRHAI